MTRSLRIALPALLLLAALAPAGPPGPAPKAVLVIHGGAGVDAKLPPALEKQLRADLEQALRAGYEALQKSGGTGVDAVEAAIRVLEDSGRFNAGKGAVFNREGRVELNASVMDGKTKKAGAVAGLTRVKNPVSAARLVMEKSEHVLLIGDGAERFARAQGLAEVSPLYFWSEQEWKRLLRDQEREKERAGKGAAAESPGAHFGTVGAVALDKGGNLAAATSTGGIRNKLPGRVGDSPLIGAGTYADTETCAVSCTGKGELFIRNVVAYDLAARMKYKKLALHEAAEEVVQGLPKEPGGVGGLIALDRQGNVAMKYNTNGMFRGYITADGKTRVAVFDE
jgi:beta-aspartyl-peptidase (threonine type)